jgi:putative heme-binding domain-containing protein
LLACLFAPPAFAQRGEFSPATALKPAKDFKAELLYSVPIAKQGSWVSMCADPKGRLIVSDQYGGLYRITPPAIGGEASATKVEKLPIPLGEAQGLLWAFDSLYVVVNGSGKFKSGLYRARSKDGDTFEKVETLRLIDGGGEHGPHAVMLAPGGKSLTVVCGNQTRLMKPLAKSRVPLHWGEDLLLPRMPDGNGFMAGVLAPGGCIYNLDPDGKKWELVSNGFRNQYDAAYNRHGELFTYDADMEWDINTPWYRPTRICQVTSGSEFGWRNGAGKWPAYYFDSVPAVVDIGLGSPTGVTFGYGAKFPAKYQEALFACDWSYGKLYAVHLKPHLSGYKAEVEEFLSGIPLPLTDLVINPVDGAMYFAVGGRKTQSGLYRVTYTGKDATTPSKSDDAGAEYRALRHKIEAFHGKRDAKAVEVAWPNLGHEDRLIRFAARIALEHQDPKTWQEKALAETKPTPAIHALLGLGRSVAADPLHTKKEVDDALKGRIFDAIDRLEWAKLDDEQRLDLLRLYEVALVRLGKPDAAQAGKIIAKLDAVYPSKVREQSVEALQILVFLQSPTVAAKTMKLIANAPTQEEQMNYALALRVLKAGWTPELRKEYFGWYVKAQTYRGGNSFNGFLRMMKADAVATLTPEEKLALKPILDAKVVGKPPVVGKPRPFVKAYTVAELVPVVEKGLKTKRDFDKGKRLFAETRCYACHRYDNEGGSAGPDLTGVSGRFGVRDLLESIIEPSKVISDQYAAVQIETVKGKTVIGRIVNLSNDTIIINTNMEEPNSMTTVKRGQIEKMETSKLSMMPTGLIDTLKEDEIVDLIAFLLSRGDRKNKMFE